MSSPLSPKIPRHVRRPGDYAAHLATEKEIYRDCLDVHDLPEIFHYWSNRYVRPKLEAFGFSSPDAMFLKYAAKQFPNGTSGGRLGSLGAGNCHLEVKLASHLVDIGCTDFVIDCLELNPDMLERGRAAAAKAGVAAFMNFVPMDLNTWSATHEYDVLIANQTLHHVLNLEHLFTEIQRSLKSDGRFITSDMIGRNGHQRWPEALALVREFWRKLPPSYRFNQSLLRYEEIYEDWDCSGESFEGIRAQDILPLLTSHFHFELFIAFANIIDPFVDRAFGNNFDAAASWDRNFIDQIHERDEEQLVSGRIQPTHILAVMGNAPRIPTLFHEPLSPEFCLRDPSRISIAGPLVEKPAYEWGGWPHNDRRELEIACQRLKEAQVRTNEQIDMVQERSRWARQLDLELESAAQRIGELQQEVKERTAWAQRLDRELESARGKIEELQQEQEVRTSWAQRLDRERAELSEVLSERTAWAKRLDRELAEQAAWIHHLDAELKETGERVRERDEDLERLAWARAIDRRLHTPIDFVFRLVRRAVHRLRLALR